MVDGERLLLVEDDAVTREVLKLLLEGEGWRVEAVESGEDALTTLRVSRVDFAVLLCDLHLDGVCGEALALRLLKSAPLALRVGMTATASNASAPGYDLLLMKPFSPRAVEDGWRSRGGLPKVGAAIPAEPLLAAETVALLRKSMGEKGMRDLLTFALADAGDRVEKMNTAATVEDQSAFTREAHALKGSCGMIGARALWQLASNAESAGLDTTAREKVTQMRGAVAELRLMLETLFAV